MSGNGQKLSDFRQRVFKMVSVGIVDDHINQGYDVISTLMLLINLFGAFAGTFDGIEAQYGEFLRQVEAVTVAFFALDYVLRMYTAPCLYPDQTGYQPYFCALLPADVLPCRGGRFPSDPGGEDPETVSHQRVL